MSPPCIITSHAPCRTTQVIDSLPFLPLIVLNSPYGDNNNTQGKLFHFLPEDRAFQMCAQWSECVLSDTDMADLKVSFQFRPHQQSSEWSLRLSGLLWYNPSLQCCQTTGKDSKWSQTMAHASTWYSPETQYKVSFIKSRSANNIYRIFKFWIATQKSVPYNTMSYRYTA